MRSLLPRIAKSLAAAILLFAVSSGAGAAESLRYLFLVDHSPEMATRQIATVQTIYDVVRTGFQNEIKADEKFAIWFYGSRLQMNPPFTWQPGHETEIARAAANLFTGRIYSRIRPREQTLGDAAPFIAASPKITVFIITDGGQPLAGTPFDTAINATITSQHFAMLRADKPFVITLLARNGSWVDGNVFANPKEPFEIPELDRRNELMEKALASVRTAPATATTPQNADAGELDKARAALRDALSGKTPAPTPQTPANSNPPKQPTAPQPQIKPAEQVQKKEEQPLPANSPAQTASVEKPTAAAPKNELPPTSAQTASVTPSPLIDRTPPLLLARPVERQSIQEQPKPAPAPESKPVTQQVAAPVPEEAKLPREEPKPVAPKPIESEQPKSVFQQEPKPAVQESKTLIQEKPKQVAQLPSPQPSQTGTTPTASPQSKPIEQAKPVIKDPAREPIPQASPPPQQPKPVAPVQTATVTPQKQFPLPIFVGGLLAIVVGGAFAFMRARQRSRSPGSIITQALPRPKTPKKLK